MKDGFEKNEFYAQQEDLERQIGYEHIRRGFLIRLLQRLCTDYSPVRHSTRQEGKEKALLYDLERYIRLHDADVTVSELEQVFHYHRNYFNLIGNTGDRLFRNMYRKYALTMRFSC